MKYRIEIIHPGELHRRRDDKTKTFENECDEIVIDIFDTKHDQFVSDYFISTLMEDRQRLSRDGLNLYGGVPAWKLSGKQMREVFATIDKHLE